MNRRAMLKAIAAPWVITTAGVLMPLAKVWSRDEMFLSNVHFSPARVLDLLRFAPMRVQQIDEMWGGHRSRWTNPEIYVRGEWLDLGRTDLIDDVATGLCATKTVEQWRAHYVAKAKHCYGGRYHDRSWYKDKEGKDMKLLNLFSVIDATTDG